MKPSTLLFTLFALVSARRILSNPDAEGDVSALMQAKTITMELVQATGDEGQHNDVSAFTAANVVVESEDEEISDTMIEDDLKRLEEEASNIAINDEGVSDITELQNLEGEWSDLGKSLEQKDIAETNFLQALQSEAAKYLNAARSKIGSGPVAMLGIGLMLLLTAFIVVCLCSNMQQKQFNGFNGGYGGYSQFDGPGDCEVWERRAIECPHKARETRITKLFQELRGGAARDGSITASDLHDLMRDPRVANEFADIGIHNFHDAMPAYKMLAAKSPDGVSVHLVEFVAMCTSPEGQLLQLFTELDEQNQCEDTPPGYVNEEDLHHMMQEPRVEAKFMSLGLSPEDAFTVFRVIESQSGNGLVSIEEFVPGCTKMKQRGRRTTAAARSQSVRSGSSNGARATMGGVI